MIYYKSIIEVVPLLPFLLYYFYYALTTTNCLNNYENDSNKFFISLNFSVIFNKWLPTTISLEEISGPVGFLQEGTVYFPLVVSSELKNDNKHIHTRERLRAYILERTL